MRNTWIRICAFLLVISCLMPLCPQGMAEETEHYTILSTRITPDPDSEVMRRVREILGVELEVIGVADEAYDATLAFLLASGNAPDAYAVNVSNLNYSALSGAATLTWDEMETYMPDVCRTIVERTENQGLSLDTLLERWSIGGKLKGFTTGSRNLTIPYGILIRTDVLEELGLGMPKTIEDWDVLLHAYKAAYPDRYPLTCANGGENQAFYMFLSAFGVRRDEWLLRDGKLQYAPLMGPMRDALVQLHAWFEDGLIDPFYFLHYAEAGYPQQAFIRGDTFFYQYYSLENALDDQANPGSLTKLTQKNFPEATFAWCPFPTKEGYGKPMVGTSDMFSGFVICFGAHLAGNRDRLHGLMRIYNMLHTNEELFLLQHVGIEGVTFDWNANHVAVIREMEYPDYAAKSRAGFGWISSTFSDAQERLRMLISPVHYRENIEMLVESEDGIYSRAYVDYQNWPRVNVPLISEEGEDLSIRNESYRSQWDAMFTGVILGMKRFDELDTFLSDWKRDVGDEMMRLANEKCLAQWLTEP